MAEYLDKAGATYLVGKLRGEVANKVDKEEGKELSTNDYTNEEKQKLAGLTNYSLPVASSGAIGGVKSGGDITVDSDGIVTVGGLAGKAPLDSPAFTGTPTAPTAPEGTNTTQVATTAFVATAVTNAVEDITGFEFVVVESLPGTGEAGKIYLVNNSGGGQNTYDEFIWVNNAWEKIGTTAVDLSGYWSKTELVAITTTEIDAMFA